MKIHITSVFVDNQDNALAFYTNVLGFEKKNDIPLGEYRWLTVVENGNQEGTELLLEPSAHPAVKPYRDALVADGIPLASFQVQDVAAEYERMQRLGVSFTQSPTDAGSVIVAVFDDTCGNLVQLVETKTQSVS